MTRRGCWWAIVGALFVVETGLIGAMANGWHPVRPVIHLQIPACICWVLLLIALSRLCRGEPPSRRIIARWLLVGCAILQLAALTGKPATSDDDFRYHWDATVQLHGVDPYRYAPADSRLDRLRDGFTFIDQVPCEHNVVPGGCTLINRPGARTIYPPVAQLAFDLMYVVSAGHGGHLPLQIFGALGVLGATLLLIRLAERRQRDLWPTAVWALSPIVALEATNNAHIEWLAVLFSLLALTALQSGRRLTAGAYIGAAIATKLYPGLLLVTAGRRPWRVMAGAAGVVLLGYLPHIAVVGPRVLGYLPTYLREESYADGNRYLLLERLVSIQTAKVLGPALLIAALLLVWWFSDGTWPEVAAVTAAGLYLLTTTPNYSWYALILIAMIAASRRLEWLWVAFAPTLQYMSAEVYWDPHRVALYGYGIGGLIVLAGTVLRRTTSATDRSSTATSCASV